MEQFFKHYKKAVVALSGGADSACVLLLAAKYLGRENVLAATCINNHFFHYEMENARSIAEKVGVELFEFNVDMPLDFYRGSSTKCYLCKKTIMTEIIAIDGYDAVFDGTNADDDLIERPGSLALSELGVISPLLELGLGKEYARDKCRNELSGISFTDESCKATRLSGPIDEFRMNTVEDFEDRLRDRLPGIRYRIDEAFVEFKKPLKISKKDFELINEVKQSDL